MRVQVLRLLAVVLASVVSIPAPVFGRDPQTTVRVRIDMRGPIAAGWFDPATEAVGLRGGAAPLSWGATLVAADPDKDGVYEVSVTFAGRAERTRFVSYKIKVDGTNNPNDGWETGDNRPLFLKKNGAVVTRAFDALGDAFPSTASGDIREHKGFASRLLPARDVFVLLPDGYDKNPIRRYPVLYMHDGQNLFDASVAGRSEWRADETARDLARRKAIEPIIIVGVASLAEERVAEYTPTAVSDPRLPADAPKVGGKADLYGRFLVEELKPFIDKTYRTQADPAHTALGGSSLGGLFSMYLGLKYSSVFGTVLVVSPSVWWDDELIVTKVRALDAKPALRIWLDMGDRESTSAIPEARHLRDALVEKGWVAGRDLDYEEFEGASHDESSWAARFDRMLRFGFGANRK